MQHAMKPIGILYEHPAWFRSLFAELKKNSVPVSRIQAKSQVTYTMTMKENKTLLGLLMVLVTVTAYPQTNADKTFTIENYYKVKWGYADEFLELYKRNHYPLLRKAIEKGDIISIKLEKPRQHSGEETRWDYRITLVFKNIQAAFDPNLTEPYKKTLYPDTEKLRKEEQRRFEILISHWDVEVQNVELEK